MIARAIIYPMNDANELVTTEIVCAMISLWGTEWLWPNARKFAWDREIMPADQVGTASPRTIATALAERGWTAARFCRANY